MGEYAELKRIFLEESFKVGEEGKAIEENILKNYLYSKKLLEMFQEYA